MEGIGHNRPISEGWIYLGSLGRVDIIRFIGGGCMELDSSYIFMITIMLLVFEFYFICFRPWSVRLSDTGYSARYRSTKYILCRTQKCVEKGNQRDDRGAE